MRIFCVIFACAIYLFAPCDGIVGGSPAQIPPADDPTVYLRFAGKTAAVKGVLDHPHYVFRGIRYASKPTGRDRFQRPRQYFLEGEEDALLYPPPCLQPLPNDPNKIIGSEDCLFLNVFTPDFPDGTEGLPVIVWIHGGGFRYGSASQYGVRNLVGRRLVLVTVQYRLGTLGFLSTGTPELPGNAALWDMALAVQWVRNYIGFFGGNPHNIVVMGQGTGASSALMVALSNIAKGSISAVVAMSGTAVSNWAIENSPGVTAKEIADYHGCPAGRLLTLIKCLQNLPADSIIEGDTQMERFRLTNRGFVSGLNGVLGTAPNSEGRFDGRSLPPVVENPPMEDMTEGNVPDIPLLVGVTKDETKRAVEVKYKPEIIDKLKSIPNFLDQVLIKNLQNFTFATNSTNSSPLGNVISVLNPLQFRNYVQVAKNNIGEGIARIAEATNDALFNLPAFLTANLWSKKGIKTFMYRFEHNGKARKGRHFLKGIPLVGNDSIELDDTVSHGDDLAYIFEARNLDGSPLDEPEVLSEEDVKVRETYTQMIADFARDKKITIDGKSVSPFTGDKNHFIQVAAKPSVSTDFRFCQMGLWAGLTERLKSKSCQFLDALSTSIKNVENLFFDTVGGGNSSVGNTLNSGVSGAKDALNKATGLFDPINVFKSKSSSKDQQPNNVPPLGFLG